MRGESIVAQPIRSNQRNLLFFWNGEVFWEHESTIQALSNDGASLFAQICAHPSSNLGEALNYVLGQIDGPYAFVLVELHHPQIWYGRDPLGRRSLLRNSSGGPFCLTSVATLATQKAQLVLEEVPCMSFWCTDMTTHWPVNRTSASAQRLLVSDTCHTESDAKLLDEFHHLLSECVKARVTNIRRVPGQKASDAQVAVLFSGGVDCSVLAALAHTHIPNNQPIDLVNVAFENPRSLAADTKRGTYDVPDRITAKASLKELEKFAPNRTWNFVEVDVPFLRYEQHLPTILSLLYPCTSVMDLSIAAALYFAAEATGTVQNRPYTSPARAFLSGLGADELLGGYSRHRQAFRRGGLEALRSELQLDLDRLPTRNLGRDDRVISSHAREARFPYLARPLLETVCKYPLMNKTDLSQGTEGVGEKRLLRMLASLLGLLHAAHLPKRAIQFGARSAKLDKVSARRKGNETL
ncbi:hypothetical protein MPSI1_003669 [Malassezia psittaci]|uniref:Asparagine synthase (glutamine-hydrolyzing) n=1 Tax=Malassezia psittaci TaxID=1821823 RepID=A0AAF0FI95_9BASI|nr:hypothetical protein MPSI1_003669 [Malassezia psittaci]